MEEDIIIFMAGPMEGITKNPMKNLSVIWKNVFFAGVA